MKNALYDAQEIEIICRVYEVFKDYKKVYYWMVTDNLNFGGCSPSALIAVGRGHKVLEFILAAKSENQPPEQSLS